MCFSYWGENQTPGWDRDVSGCCISLASTVHSGVRWGSSPQGCMGCQHHGCAWCCFVLGLWYGLLSSLNTKGRNSLFCVRALFHFHNWLWMAGGMMWWWQPLMAGCIILVALDSRRGKSYWFSPPGILDGSGHFLNSFCRMSSLVQPFPCQWGGFQFHLHFGEDLH